MSAVVVPASLGHALRVGRQLKPEILAKAPMDPRRVIACFYRQSRRVNALLIDGRPVAICGVMGTLLSGDATIWLMVTRDIGHHAKAFLRACKAEVEYLRRTNDRLIGVVAPDDERAASFCRHFGFEVGEVMPDGMRRAVLERSPDG